MGRKDMLLAEDLKGCPYLVRFFNAKIQGLKKRPASMDSQSRRDEVALILAFKRKLSLKQIAENRGWNYSTMRTWARQRAVLMKQGAYLQEFSRSFVEEISTRYDLMVNGVGDPRNSFHNLVHEFELYSRSLQNAVRKKFEGKRDNVLLSLHQKDPTVDYMKELEKWASIDRYINRAELEISSLDSRNMTTKILKDEQDNRLIEIDSVIGSFSQRLGLLRDRGDVTAKGHESLMQMLDVLTRKIEEDQRYITKLQIAYVQKSKQKK